MNGKRGILGSRWIELACRIFLGGLFIYAAVHKIANPAEFAEDIYNYHLVPGAFVNFLAIVLPWFELIAGGLLILGIFVSGATFMLLIMLAVFTAAIGINIVRGIDFDCGCFGSGEGLCAKIVRFADTHLTELSAPQSIRGKSSCEFIRDIFFLLIGGFIFFFKGERLTVKPLVKSVYPVKHRQSFHISPS